MKITSLSLGIAAIFLLATALAAHADIAALPDSSGITRLNIHIKQGMPEDIFREIAKQGGVKFAVDEGFWEHDSTLTPMDIDFTDRAFWPGLLEACQKCGIATEDFYGGGFSGGGFAGSNNASKRIRLVIRNNGDSEPPKPLPTVVSGGFVIQATNFSWSQSLQYETPRKPQTNCTLQIRIFVDPSLNVQSADPMATVTAAEDDLGNSMVSTVKRPVRMRLQPVQSMVFTRSIPLTLPDIEAKQIAHLKASLQLQVTDSMQELAIEQPLVAAEVSKQSGGITFVMHSLTKVSEDTNDYEMKVRMLHADGSVPADLIAYLRNMKLLDDKGHRAWPQNQVQVTAGAKNEFHITFIADAGGATTQPAKLTLELPTNSHTVKVPIEFSDLPLPSSGSADQPK